MQHTYKNQLRCAALVLVFVFLGLRMPHAADQTLHEADSLFGLTNLWTLHLKINADDWTAMRPELPERSGPPGGGPPFGAEGIHAPAAPPGGPPPINFKVVPATLEFEGKTYEKIGLRFKGNSSYMMAQNSLKHPFKLDFNEYVKGQKFFGLTKLSLNNNAMDSTQMREALAYEMFRQAGVAAPRTAFAQVYLTVPGQYARRYAGLYTLVENVDERFLQRHFGSKKGLLLKPEVPSGLPYLGEAWEAYKKGYDPRTEVTVEQARRFIAFIRLVNDSSDAVFREGIGSYLEVESFLRFLAVQTATANLDSFLSMGHNYYLYLHPTSQKFCWIPWDLNDAFGHFVMAGSATRLMNLSIDHPHVGENKLIERLLAIPEYRQHYRTHLEKFAANFRGGKIQADIDALTPLLRPALREDPLVMVEQFETSVFRSLTPGSPERAEETTRHERSPFRVVSRPNTGPPLKDWLIGRAESLTEQLQGKRPGELPQLGPMLVGPGGPADMGPGLFLAPEMFAAADVNGDAQLTRHEFQELARQWFGRFDVKKRKSLTLDELVSGLNGVLRPAPGEAGRGAHEFGPGTFLGPALFRAADSSRDGDLSAEEFTGAFDRWFTQWSSDPSGVLNEEQLTRGLNRLLGRAL